METSPERAQTLTQEKEDFERQIETLAREYEGEHPGPVELDLTIGQGNGDAAEDNPLQRRVVALVESFHRRPVVADSGVRVHKITAIDSDGDGSVAVNVTYDHPGY